MVQPLVGRDRPCQPASMNERYTCMRSAKKRLRFVIHYGGEENFYSMPLEICNLGPWTDIRNGDVIDLKMEYRRELARKGWVLVENAPLGFSEKAGS